MPPSIEELTRRLVGRNTDSDDVINKRIVNASIEMKEASWYDHVVINDIFKMALAQLKEIMQADHN